MKTRLLLSLVAAMGLATSLEASPGGPAPIRLHFDIVGDPAFPNGSPIQNADRVLLSYVGNNGFASINATMYASNGAEVSVPAVWEDSETIRIDVQSGDQNWVARLNRYTTTWTGSLAINGSPTSELVQLDGVRYALIGDGLITGQTGTDINESPSLIPRINDAINGAGYLLFGSTTRAPDIKLLDTVGNLKQFPITNSSVDVVFVLAGQADLREATVDFNQLDTHLGLLLDEIDFQNEEDVPVIVRAIPYVRDTYTYTGVSGAIVNQRIDAFNEMLSQRVGARGSEWHYDADTATEWNDTNDATGAYLSLEGTVKIANFFREDMAALGVEGAPRLVDESDLAGEATVLTSRLDGFSAGGNDVDYFEISLPQNGLTRRISNTTITFAEYDTQGELRATLLDRYLRPILGLDGIDGASFVNLTDGTYYVAVRSETGSAGSYNIGHNVPSFVNRSQVGWHYSEEYGWLYRSGNANWFFGSSASGLGWIYVEYVGSQWAYSSSLGEWFYRHEVSDNAFTTANLGDIYWDRDNASFYRHDTGQWFVLTPSGVQYQ